jgi:hypothetical protein
MGIKHTSKERIEEVNRQIAEKIFGLRILRGHDAIKAANWPALADKHAEVWVRPDGLQAYCVGTSGAPNYSGDMVAAWLVVDAMKKRDKNLYLICYTYNRTYASFCSLDGDDDMQEANGDTATPEAICLAALKAC